MRVLNQIEHTPEPNVLLAGIQFIMSRDRDDRLEAHYPNFAGGGAGTEGVDAPFREFVLRHESELVEIGRTRYTQTNECRRCVALLPAIWISGAERFHLIDLGASAGLNLILDRYQYRWGEVAWGERSPVHLVTESRGAPVTPRHIEILSRIGLDLHPVDPRDADDRRWLEALIWPEHHERRQRLREALDMASTADFENIEGDALLTLGPAIDSLPNGDDVVVMHSFALNQFHPSMREKVSQIIDESRERRMVHRVSLEALDSDDNAATLTMDGGAGSVKVGRAQPHGEWIELYALP